MRCKNGFGPDYCSMVMCEHSVLDCVFVQEWIRLNQQAIVFRLFWESVETKKSSEVVQ